MTRLIALLVVLMALAGCASQPPVNEPTAPVVVPSDPQQCLTRAECTTKLSRTLLFIFDYAAAGAPLVQREGRLLFTPADAPVSDWPALYVRLAEAERIQCAVPDNGLSPDGRAALAGLPQLFAWATL